MQESKADIIWKKKKKKKKTRKLNIKLIFKK